MRRVAFAAFAGALSVGAFQSASAADMPLKAAPMVAGVNWTSCYVGGNAGGEWGRFKDSANTPAGTAVIAGAGTAAFAADSIALGRLNRDSGVFGGQVGCRWQTPERWVFGIEGDADWSNLRARAVETIPGTGGSVFIPGDNFENRSRWQSSARLTAGRSWDRWLAYVTGGVAFTRVSMDGNFIATVAGGVPFPASAGSDSKTLVGGTVGAGVAYALNNNWDIGAEYRYTAYQSDDFALGNVAAVCAVVGGGVSCFNTAVTGHKSLQTSEILFKLNYRFNNLLAGR